VDKKPRLNPSNFRFARFSGTSAASKAFFEGMENPRKSRPASLRGCEKQNLSL
jgi:hypothetical protein